MPEKGFDLKVLIPTDDGLTISENGVQQALFYLLYNVSSRSFQLAGKVKTSEWYPNLDFNIDILYKLLKEENIDLVLTLSTIGIDIPCDNKVANNPDIGINLERLIDITDKKRANRN